MNPRRSRGLSIRAKLLLLSLAVLSVPYVGLEYLRELERHLQDSFEDSLMDTARAVAGPLQEQQDLFPINPEPPDRSLYIHDLENPVQLDGYTDDWLMYLGWANRYTAETGGLSYRFIVSRRDPYYYGMLQVRDDSLVLQRPDTPDAVDNDHVVLVFTDPRGRVQHYYFSPAAPGKIRPFRFETVRDDFGFESRITSYATSITGEFQPTEEGYNLELAIPINLVGGKLGLVVTDVSDAESREVAARLGTAGPRTLQDAGRIIQPSEDIQRVIGRFGDVDGRRIWVLDHQGQVLASSGSLERGTPLEAARSIFALLLPPVSQRFSDDLAGASRLQGAEVRSALSGQTDTRWRSSTDARAIIVSAAAPVFAEGRVRGAVVVEETTTAIQMLRRQAMISLLNKTVLVFLGVSVLLLFFATWLSYRLRRLSRDAGAAIDEHGRVVGEFVPGPAGDEIGEVAQSFAAMLKRLRDYNHYLENLGGRLSHELRTPISVVRSSLEQLQEDNAGNEDAYLARAREGVERLNVIVTRLGEAARLEQAIQEADLVETDIPELMENCVAGYRLAYPDCEFRLQMKDAPLRARISPDLFVQMLDKLIANAVDFNPERRPVEVALDTGHSNWSVSVTNYGARLPEAMAGQLFNSMISVRDREKSDSAPHLGLGLYMVRLITEFHHGRIRAENLATEQGVRFSVEFSR